MLTAVDLRVRFRWPGGPPVVALDRASLQLRPGESVGVVGESGSGKTTLLRALLGVVAADRGQVMLDGEPVQPRRGPVPRRLRRRIQLVPQDPYTSLNPRQRIGTILGLPLRVHRGLRGTAAGAVAADLLARVGLAPELLARTPAEFSGGQRQRIAIARALSVEPRYLLLDEPLSALDAATAAGVRDLLRELRQHTQLGMLLVSHDLDLVDALCERTTRVDHGVLTEFARRVSPKLHDRPRRDGAGPVRSAAMTVTPYGEWVSPISATALTTAARRLGFPTLVSPRPTRRPHLGDEVWWTEDRPAEGGRTTVMARRADGSLAELLPAPWGARSRVHEYGGHAFLGIAGPDGPVLVFANFTDQRLYRLDPGGGPPAPLTPEPAGSAQLRYADLILAPDGREIWCVRERHHDGDLDRQIVAVPVDGQASADPAAVREVVGGSRFLSNPRLSPDGSKLAWLAWDHPNMPWDGTELRVGKLETGRISAWSAVLGGPTESVFQPDWDGEHHLLAVSDRTGWWNLYRVPAHGSEPITPLCPREEEFGAPLWQLGAACWGRLDDGRLLCVHGTGTQRLGILDPATGELSDLDLPYQNYSASLAVTGDRAVVVASTATSPPAVILVDATTQRAEEVRPAVDPANLPDQAWLPVPESTALTGPNGREVHANIYPPRNPDHSGPPDARPPYVVFIHGGPTSHSAATVDLSIAYLTSRGIGVLDVNYGGSTGYGRAYRERLTGGWGVVDVEDAAAAALALVDRGDADPDRLAIRGGSAGGWTTLCALTGTDVFAAGTSRYGVADILRLAETTHDFESRYLEKLVGQDVLANDTRSPLHRADQVRVPVLLLQGTADPIVPAEQAEQFRDALARNGIRHALVVFPGEYHGFRKAESIVASAEAELSFYGQVMGFDPPGVPRLELSG